MWYNLGAVEKIFIRRFLTMSFNIYTATEIKSYLKAADAQSNAEREVEKFSIKVAQMVDRMFDHSMRLHFVDFNSAIPDFFNSEGVTKMLQGTGFAIRECEYPNASVKLYYLVITDSKNAQTTFGHSPKEIHERYEESKKGISEEAYNEAREWLLRELEVVTGEMFEPRKTFMIPEKYLAVAEKGLFREDVESYGYTYLRRGNEITICVSMDE